MKTIQEIEKIRNEKRPQLDLRINTQADTREKHILVCQGTGCTSSKSPQILEEFKKILKEKGYELVPISELIIRENYEIDHEGRQHSK